MVYTLKVITTPLEVPIQSGEIIDVYVIYVHLLVWNEPNLITLAGGFWDGSQVQSL